MNRNYGMELKDPEGPAAMPDSLLDRYRDQLMITEGRVERLKSLIKLLETNPATLEIMQLMGQV